VSDQQWRRLLSRAFVNSPPRRYLPVIDKGPKGEFWRCGADGVLRISRCQACGLWIHPHADACRRCRSRDIAPEPVSGRGSVETFTINRQPWWRELTEPYAVAIVTLAEQAGLNLTTNIVGCPLDAIHIGMPVRVVFENVEDVWLALFEPLERPEL
jgi:uncharacterized OB-fold protein